MATQKISLNWKDGVHFESKGPGGNVPIDGSEEVGGQGKGLRPKALMLSALAGCSGIDVASLIKKMRIDVDTFDIDVEAELTEEHPKFYHKVWVNFNFYGDNLNQKKIEKAVTLSVDTYCGVMEMFRQFATVETKINYFPKK
ncbi:putative redox protein [Wenyingzhuangia heitensis]|uniref:Redox protein n=1 Tax=Wenyingzhuangia heitensis TaxID=1487859 RepID=A0ABX0U9A7_9FLAO|nr:OsmC family protein [Wenyingzhuangia heitensis]NIJ43652.1 putative redox protein [Wenyingzhuangia heitensis]